MYLQADTDLAAARALRFARCAVEPDDSAAPRRSTAARAEIEALRRRVAVLEQERAQEAERRDRRANALAKIVHELRTPLNGILGFAAMPEVQRGDPKRLAQALRVIRDCGEHQLALIEDIVELARLDARMVALHPAELPLRDWLARGFEMVKVRAEARRLQATLVVADDVPDTVQADPKRLRQILLNLPSNAVHCTREGGVTLAVSRLPGDAPAGRCRLRFSVRDTGRGMNAQEQQALFQLFRRHREAEEPGSGTGIGLAVTGELAALMGAQISVVSAVGEGSDFRVDIELPAGA